MRAEQPDAVRFTTLWDEHTDHVLAYVRHRVPPDDAQEVVAETFLVAWRRLADVRGPALELLLVVVPATRSPTTGAPSIGARWSTASWLGWRL